MKTTIISVSLLLASPAWAQDEIKAAAAEPTAAEPAAEPTAEPAAEPVAEPAAEPAEPAAEPAEPAVESEGETAPTGEPLGIVVGAKLGGTVPTSDLGFTYFLGLDAAYQLPFFDHLLGVGIELSLSGPTGSGTVTSAAVGGDVPYTIAMRLITLGFEVSGARSIGDFTPYAALGYGIYFLHADVESFGDNSTEDQVRAGFHVRGGCGYPVGPGDVFAELRYHYVNLRFLSTGKSNAGGITLNAGYRYTF